MSMVEKRFVACLGGALFAATTRRLSAIDEVLMDLMDTAVRSEYRRLSSSQSSSSLSDNTMATTNQGSGGERATLLRRMGEALENGELDEATALRAEFAFKTALRADPTQETGSYDPYLDQDDWYAEARRKAMQSKNTRDE